MPPCLYRGEVAEVRALDITALTDKVRVTNGTEEERDAIRFACALLVANAEVLDWVALGVGGSNSNWEDVANALHGTGPFGLFELVVVLEEGSHEACQGTPAGFADSGVHICRDLEELTTAVQAFRVGTDADIACATIHLAGVVLHELTHVVDFSVDDPVDPDVGYVDCFRSYLMAGNFEWAMFQRYPVAARSPCCRLAQQDGPDIPDELEAMLADSFLLAEFEVDVHGIEDVWLVPSPGSRLVDSLWGSVDPTFIFSCL